jgi:tRNA-modifying protein YgfZ
MLMTTAQNVTDFSVLLNTADGPLVLIRVQGEDAASFLQGQLTQDVLLMNENEARLAAWCSAKGRMLASFIVVKASHAEFYLLMSRDLLAPTLKRLKMFVLRAKCELADVSAQFSVTGLAGGAAVQALTILDTENAINSIARTPDSMTTIGHISSQKLILLSAGWQHGQAVQRMLRIEPAPPADVASEQLSAHWQALEISSGIARITAAVTEAFVPQMLNYESIGGVNFKKGCYPGQEVVARSQFRGTLKRRAYIVTSDAPLQAGQEVFDAQNADQPEQPCGMVAQSASCNGMHSAIVSMQIAASSSPALHAGSAQGPRLQLQTLPYALRDDI